MNITKIYISNSFLAYSDFSFQRLIIIYTYLHSHTTTHICMFYFYLWGNYSRRCIRHCAIPTANSRVHSIPQKSEQRQESSADERERPRLESQPRRLQHSLEDGEHARSRGEGVAFNTGTARQSRMALTVQTLRDKQMYMDPQCYDNSDRSEFKCEPNISKCKDTKWQRRLTSIDLSLLRQLRIKECVGDRPTHLYLLRNWVKFKQNKSLHTHRTVV